MAVLCVAEKGFSQNNERVNLSPVDSLIRLHPKVFNINNIPINICFIKDKASYKGFIIAGHARKAVCQLASLEVKNNLDSLGYTDSTVFSYGVGYDFRENDTDGRYNLMLQKMQTNFAAIRDSNLFEVRMFEVQLTEYKAKQEQIRDIFSTIKKKFADTGLAAKPAQYIVNHRNTGFPLVVPFFTADSIIRFHIPDQMIGELPAQNFQRSVITDLNRNIALYKKMQTFNQNAISRILASTNSHKAYNFSYYEYNEIGEIEKLSNDLGGFPKPPDDFKMTTMQNNKVVGTRPVTYEEAVSILQNPNGVQIDYNTRKLLEFYIDEVRQFSLAFSRNKNELVKNIKSANLKLKRESDAAAKLLASINNLPAKSNDNSLAMDAFLRGWTFNSNDTLMNRKLYNWYAVKRPMIWKYILSAYPGLTNVENPLYDPKTPLLAGVFQSENVFFHVQNRDGYYIVTPYQMLGGDFAEVVDKNIPVPLFYTLNNFRTNNY